MLLPIDRADTFKNNFVAGAPIAPIAPIVTICVWLLVNILRAAGTGPRGTDRLFKSITTLKDHP